MAYCTVTEVQNLTGSTLSSTILTDIISQADRDVAAELAQRGLTGGDTDTLKNASLCFVKIGLLERGKLTGQYDGSNGDSSTGGVDATITGLRNRAKALLDALMASQESLPTITYMLKVNG